MIQIDKEKCKGCKLCIEACSQDVIGIDNEYNQAGYYPAKIIDADKCISCGLCQKICPEMAIKID